MQITARRKIRPQTRNARAGVNTGAGTGDGERLRSEFTRSLLAMQNGGKKPVPRAPDLDARFHEEHGAIISSISSLPWKKTNHRCSKYAALALAML